MLTIRHLTFVNTVPLAILLNNSGSSDRRDMILLPLESSHRGESNGGKNMFLGAIDGEIKDEMLTIRHLTFVNTAPLAILLNILGSSNYRSKILLPLESSHRGKSNGSKNMFLRAINSKI